jgi:transposase
VITREQSRGDADGGRPGAPDAIQVADRFHLVQNLVEALDQVFNAHSHALEAVHEALHQAPVTQPDGTVAVPVPPPSSPRSAQELAHPRQARRLALHQQIGAFHQQGWPGWAMAQPLGIGKHTVFRALRTKTLPARKRRTDRGRSRLTPDTPDLLERWNAGCRDALRLFREIHPQGDPGSDATVARDAQRLRQAQGEAPRPRRRRHPLPLVTAPPHRALTPRRATWLVLRRPELRTPAEQERLMQLTAQEAPLADAIALAQDVAQLVGQRQPEHLDPWLARAAESPLVPLQRFAKGLRDDYDAVKAGVTLPWSHGPWRAI